MLCDPRYADDVQTCEGLYGCTNPVHPRLSRKCAECKLVIAADNGMSAEDLCDLAEDLGEPVVQIFAGTEVFS